MKCFLFFHVSGGSLRRRRLHLSLQDAHVLALAFFCVWREVCVPRACVRVSVDVIASLC